MIRACTGISFVPPTRRIFLQNAQQLALQIVRHRTDLISRAPPARLLKQSRAINSSPVKPPFAVPNRMPSSSVRYRRTVLRQERSVLAAARVVNALRQQLLAGAGLTVDEHRCIVARRLLRSADQLPKRRRVFSINIAIVWLDAARAEYARLCRRPPCPFSQPSGVSTSCGYGDVLWRSPAATVCLSAVMGIVAVDCRDLLAV